MGEQNKIMPDDHNVSLAEVQDQSDADHYLFVTTV
jgi:hypothetical protein